MVSEVLPREYTVEEVREQFLESARAIVHWDRQWRFGPAERILLGPTWEEHQAIERENVVAWLDHLRTEVLEAYDDGRLSSYGRTHNSDDGVRLTTVRFREKSYQYFENGRMMMRGQRS